MTRTTDTNNTPHTRERHTGPPTGETDGTPDVAHVDTTTVTFTVTGMTCATCAARIQRKFDKHPGIRGDVNYAAETATVHLLPGTTVDDVIALINKIGFTLTPRTGPAHSASTAGSREQTAAMTALRRRLIAAAFLAIPVIVLSMVPAAQFYGWQWLALALTVPIMAYCGYPFHRAALLNARQRAATMDTLVSLGTLAAFGWSVWLLADWAFSDPASPNVHDHQHAGHDATTHNAAAHDLAAHAGGPHVYLEAAAAITLFLLAGRYFELRSRRKAGAAVRELLTLGVDHAAVMRDGHEIRMPIDALRVGDHFIARPGDKIATDGVVIDGTSDVNNALITGESVPVPVTPGDPVTGATLNTTGRLIIEATQVGADTQLAHIAKLVETAQNGKAPVQRLADRISAWFVPVVIALATITLASWLLSGAAWARSFEAAIAVLIIACPCALGLATPMALLVGTGRGAELGILVSGPEVLEKTQHIDTVVLDKTGTVTTATMTVANIYTLDELSTDDPTDDTARGEPSTVEPNTGAPNPDDRPDEKPATTPDTNLTASQREALTIAAAIENASEHPIARAIVNAATHHNLTIPDVTNFTATPGGGATGVVDGHTVLIGSATFATNHNQRIPDQLTTQLDTITTAGHTPVVIAWRGIARAAVAISDTIKPTSVDGITALKHQNLTPILLTGDDQRVADRVATHVGIGHVIAGATPASKTEAISNLQNDGKHVAMVGDGVNDAAALAQADVGLAMRSGSDAAIQAADITLMRNDLTSAATALRLSRRTLRTIKTNLFWAFAYNVAAIPLAMAGLLNPMIAGAAMALSSVFVVANSLTLRRFS